MTPIDIAAIEHRAHRLRAEELQRLEGLLVERLRRFAQLLGRGVLSLLSLVSDMLRPLFSWNPRHHGSH